MFLYTVKPLNFARDLISLILQVMKIREIKYPRMFKFYIDSNSKASRFAKLSTCKDGSNLQFAKLSPREIKVFYSTMYRSISGPLSLGKKLENVQRCLTGLLSPGFTSHWAIAKT